jgi:large subunit ribosomal protein L3
MKKGILGRKLGMTQIFGSDGKLTPATVIQAGPCVVMNVWTADKNGYEALQLGFDDRKRSRATKADRGIAHKSNTEPKKFVREIRQSVDGVKVGDVVDVSVFDGVEYVDVTGTTKGRGFAGVMKRWNFRGSRASHGAVNHRTPGAIGQHSDSSRVFKGHKMAGHYGTARCTVKRLKVVRSEKNRNLLMVRGAVPGANGSYVVVRNSYTEVKK